MKNKITLAVVALIIALGCIFGYKQYKAAKYRKNLKEFVVEAGKSAMVSGAICESIRDIWWGYIFDDRKYFNSSTGETEKWYSSGSYCSDFSQAVHKKIEWNKENLPSDITVSYYIARNLYKEMTPPPSKYKEAHIYVKQMFKAMEKLHDLSENPTGNLSSYASNVNEAVNDLTSALKDLSIEGGINLSDED